MAERVGRSVENLYAVTGGNPFFVTEALASKEEGVPVTVRDAVLSRAARLSAAARAVTELVSVVPARTEKWLLDETIKPAASALDECLNAGMVRLEGETLAFRHELARLAIEDSIPALWRQSLHKEVLKALSARGPEQIQLARLVHHAALAGDEAAVLQFTPLAAKQAAALNAHREAASHYETALRCADRLPAEERARLFEGRSYECYLTDQIVEAIEARQAALEIWRRLDRRREQGDCLRWMSRLTWFSGRKDEAERYATEAVAALEDLPPGPELAMAWSNRAQLHMLSFEVAEAIDWGSRAIELAERIGATEALVHALNNVGTAQTVSHQGAGRENLEQSLRLALAGNLQEHAARAWTNLAARAVADRDYREAISYLNEGLDYATEHDLDSWRLYMAAWRARAHFEQGDWTSAADEASWVLGHYRVSAITKIPALAVLGHVRVRRGDPDVDSILNEARDLAIMWEQIGCPYEQAMALADGDEEARRSALEIFERLGAGPAAEALRQRLRAAGVRGLSRGPRPSTKENPLGLTTRQMEVLALMAEGLSNAEIAERLFISPKTVDHHVSAILAKFDAHSRAEAVAQAQQRGILARTK